MPSARLFLSNQNRLAVPKSMQSEADHSKVFINKDSLPSQSLCDVWPHRLSVRTSGFHPEKRGSIPRGATNRKRSNYNGVSRVENKSKE